MNQALEDVLKDLERQLVELNSTTEWYRNQLKASSEKAFNLKETISKLKILR